MKAKQSVKDKIAYDHPEWLEYMNKTYDKTEVVFNERTKEFDVLIIKKDGSPALDRILGYKTYANASAYGCEKLVTMLRNRWAKENQDDNA